MLGKSWVSKKFLHVGLETSSLKWIALKKLILKKAFHIMQGKALIFVGTVKGGGSSQRKFKKLWPIGIFKNAFLFFKAHEKF